MKCKICGKKLTQISGWFLGEANYQCDYCIDNVEIQITDRFTVRPPKISTLGVYSFGIVFDSKHNRLYTEKQFKGIYTDTAAIINALNNVKYNDCSDWRLPYPIELIDLIDLGLTATSDFPGIEKIPYFAHKITGANNITDAPVVDFSTGQIRQVSYNQVCKFILIQN